MARSGLVCMILAATALANLAAQDHPTTAQTNQVILKYLGAAGWEITDGTTTILIDPYLSRINGPPPPEGHRMAGDTRRAYDWGDVAVPDVAAIDSQILFWSRTRITTTSWTFLTSPLKLERQ